MSRLHIFSFQTVFILLISLSGQQYIAAGSAEDIDALLNQAQRNGNQRLDQINREVRNKFDAANANYQVYARQVSEKLMQRQFDAYGAVNAPVAARSTGSFAAAVLPLAPAMVEKTSCSGDYSQLESVIKNYQDAGLANLRRDMLGTRVAEIISAAKAQTGNNKHKAMELSQMQAAEHDRVVSEASRSASETWGGPGEDIAEQLKAGRLPLNISCTLSIPYQSICAAIANQWGSLGSRFTIEIMKKCW